MPQRMDAAIELQLGHGSRQDGEAQLAGEHDRAEHADLFADDQPGRGAKGQRVAPGAGRQRVETQAGIGEAEQRQDEEGYPGLQPALESLRRAALVAGRDDEGQRDPRERGVQTGAEHQDPEYGAAQHIGQQGSHPGPVEQIEAQQQGGGARPA